MYVQYLMQGVVSRHWDSAEPLHCNMRLCHLEVLCDTPVNKSNLQLAVHAYTCQGTHNMSLDKEYTRVVLGSDFIVLAESAPREISHESLAQ